MKLVEGKKYMTQDGRIVTITTVKNGYAVGEFEHEGKMTWGEDGHFGHSHPHMNLKEIE